MPKKRLSVKVSGQKGSEGWLRGCIGDKLKELGVKRFYKSGKWVIETDVTEEELYKTLNKIIDGHGTLSIKREQIAEAQELASEFVPKKDEEARD